MAPLLHRAAIINLLLLRLLQQQQLLLLLPFNSHLSRWTWVSQFTLRSCICSGREPLGINETGFLWAGCPSCYPTTSVKALNGTQSTNHNQWPGLILSLLTTRLLKKGVLFPLCQLFSIITYLPKNSSINLYDPADEQTATTTTFCAKTEYPQLITRQRNNFSHQWHALKMLINEMTLPQFNYDGQMSALPQFWPPWLLLLSAYSSQR